MTWSVSPAGSEGPIPTFKPQLLSAGNSLAGPYTSIGMLGSDKLSGSDTRTFGRRIGPRLGRRTNLGRARRFAKESCWPFSAYYLRRSFRNDQEFDRQSVMPSES